MEHSLLYGCVHVCIERKNTVLARVSVLLFLLAMHRHGLQQAPSEYAATSYIMARSLEVPKSFVWRTVSSTISPSS